MTGYEFIFIRQRLNLDCNGFEMLFSLFCLF